MRGEDKRDHSRSSQVGLEQPEQIEEALRRSEERYLLAEWATNDGLWDWEPVSDACYFSPQFHALLGLKDGELKYGAHIFARLHPGSEPLLFKAVQAHFEDNQPYDLEIQIRVADGSYR